MSFTDFVFEQHNIIIRVFSGTLQNFDRDILEVQEVYCGSWGPVFCILVHIKPVNSTSGHTFFSACHHRTVCIISLFTILLFTEAGLVPAA